MNSPQCLPATAAGNDDEETVESEQKKIVKQIPPILI